MSSVNKAILVGNVGKDPEIRRTNAGKKVASFSLATSNSWRDKTTGERKQQTDWHNVVVFDERLADVVEQYVHKGSKVYVQGQIKTRKWQDKNGQDRYTTEIVLSAFHSELVLLDKSGGSDRPAADESSYGKTTSREPAADFDDKIPF